MILDLGTSIVPDSIMKTYQYLPFEDVVNVPASAEELALALENLQYKAVGSEDMDCKESNPFRMNFFLDILSYIPDTAITSFSDGGKYGHVYFTYKGVQAKLGHQGA